MQQSRMLIQGEQANDHEWEQTGWYWPVKRMAAVHIQSCCYVLWGWCMGWKTVGAASGQRMSWAFERHRSGDAAAPRYSISPNRWLHQLDIASDKITYYCVVDGKRPKGASLLITRIPIRSHSQGGRQILLLQTDHRIFPLSLNDEDE